MPRPMKPEPDRRSFIKSSSLGTLSLLTGGLSDTLIAETEEPPAAKHRYDCIVLGLGAMGSACLYQLAGRGARALGLEQFDIAHALGSSGGISRQTKVAPYLGSRHEPLIRRANENWRTLETDSGQQVFHQCGYLRLDRNQELADGADGTIRLLNEDMLSRRFPQFQNLPPGTTGLYDNQGGLLRSELAIASHCLVALRKGAQIRAREPATSWTTDADGVSVTTTRGKYRARHLVIAAGAWNRRFLPRLSNRLEVTRLSVGWLAPEQPDSFAMRSFPTWEHGAHYGFPVLPDFPGLKLAQHWKGDPADPDTIDRVPNAGDEKRVRDYLGRHLPAANGTILAFKICMYTHGGPWLGTLPGEKRVSCIAACNGGGFKFSSAYGEALADLATEGKTDLPVHFMGFGEGDK